jgi:hypothetical protein
VRPRKHDLIVLDTPPTANAIDFLDAPKQVRELIDNPGARLLAGTGRVSAKILGLGGAVLGKTLATLGGGEFIGDLGTFLREFADPLVPDPPARERVEQAVFAQLGEGEAGRRAAERIWTTHAGIHELGHRTRRSIAAIAQTRPDVQIWTAPRHIDPPDLLPELEQRAGNLSLIHLETPRDRRSGKYRTMD